MLGISLAECADAAIAHGLAASILSHEGALSVDTELVGEAIAIGAADRGRTAVRAAAVAKAVPESVGVDVLAVATSAIAVDLERETLVAGFALVRAFHAPEPSLVRWVDTV